MHAELEKFVNISIVENREKKRSRVSRIAFFLFRVIPIRVIPGWCKFWNSYLTYQQLLHVY